MFSINVDKLLKLTDSEHDCYLSSANKVLAMMGNDCKVLGCIGDGMMAFRLAATIHEAGKKVLFIDADVKDETFIAKYKLGKNIKGFTSYLSSDDEASKYVCLTNRNDLDVVFTGDVSGVSVKAIDLGKVKSMLKEFSDYDYIVCNSEDSGRLAACCDRVVLMVMQSEYNEGAVAKRVEALDKQDCYVLGVIINSEE